MLKKIFYPLFFILVVLACEKDRDVDNNGANSNSTTSDTTNNNNTNEKPETDKRDAYVGDYSVRDSLYSPLGGLEEVKFYTLHIEKHSSTDSILISNLADTSWYLTAAFYDTTFYVRGQYIDDSNRIHASGNGSFQKDSLYMYLISSRYSHRIDGKK